MTYGYTKVLNNVGKESEGRNFITFLMMTWVVWVLHVRLSSIKTAKNLVVFTYMAQLILIDWNINVYASTMGILIFKDHIITFGYI